MQDPYWNKNGIVVSCMSVIVCSVVLLAAEKMYLITPPVVLSSKSSRTIV